MNRPKIVCLCGSTRFFEAFQRANYEETMAGRIVLSVGFFMHRPDTVHGETFGCTPEQKKGLDALHLRKIDLADETLILNVDGYIGESTKRELAYTIGTRKGLRFLEPLSGKTFVKEHAEELAILSADLVLEASRRPKYPDVYVVLKEGDSHGTEDGTPLTVDLHEDVARYRKVGKCLRYTPAAGQ
jgi:hypothetical protein